MRVPQVLLMAIPLARSSADSGGPGPSVRSSTKRFPVNQPVSSSLRLTEVVEITKLVSVAIAGDLFDSFICIVVASTAMQSVTGKSNNWSQGP